MPNEGKSLDPKIKFNQKGYVHGVKRQMFGFHLVRLPATV